MILTFLNHQWKAFWRSRNKAASILAQSLLALFILYFLAAAIFVGFGMELFIGKIFPGQNPITVFNGFILYYFLIDLAMRLQLQELPTLSVIPYLHLKVSRRQIVNFLNIKSLFSLFNFLPFFVFFPFIITELATSLGGP
jgi:hypothetical protein